MWKHAAYWNTFYPKEGGRRDNHEEESFSSHGNGCSYGSNASGSWCSSKPSQSESDGTIGNDSSSSSSSSNNTVSNSGNTENQNTPGVASGATKEAEKTVVQGANNERVEVVGTTKDSKGTTVGLVGNDAGKGSVSSDNGASVSIATGDAEVAGLSDSAKSDINDLNSGKAPSEVIPNSGLEDYASVGGTRAIVSKNAAGQDVSTNVTLYVDALTAGKKLLLHIMTTTLVFGL